nr:hypothetical protein CFP56_40121 [Quercus suber]
MHGCSQQPPSPAYHHLRRYLVWRSPLLRPLFQAQSSFCLHLRLCCCLENDVAEESNATLKVSTFLHGFESLQAMCIGGLIMSKVPYTNESMIGALFGEAVVLV